MTFDQCAHSIPTRQILERFPLSVLNTFNLRARPPLTMPLISTGTSNRLRMCLTLQAQDNHKHTHQLRQALPCATTKMSGPRHSHDAVLACIDISHTLVSVGSALKYILYVMTALCNQRGLNLPDVDSFSCNTSVSLAISFAHSCSQIRARE